MARAPPRFHTIAAGAHQGQRIDYVGVLPTAAVPQGWARARPDHTRCRSELKRQFDRLVGKQDGAGAVTGFEFGVIQRSLAADKDAASQTMRLCRDPAAGPIPPDGETAQEIEVTDSAIAVAA